MGKTQLRHMRRVRAGLAACWSLSLTPTVSRPAAGGTVWSAGRYSGTSIPLSQKKRKMR